MRWLHGSSSFSCLSASSWHSTHNELTKKIDWEPDPEARRELIKLQGQIDRGRAGF